MNNLHQLPTVSKFSLAIIYNLLNCYNKIGKLLTHSPENFPQFLNFKETFVYVAMHCNVIAGITWCQYFAISIRGKVSVYCLE